MKFKKTTYKNIFLIIAFLIFLSIIFEFDRFVYFGVIPFVLLLVSCFLVLYVRKNNLLFLLFIGLLYFNYSICNGLYFQQLEIYKHLFVMLPLRTWEVSISVLTLFEVILAYFIKKPKENFNLIKNENNVLYVVSFIYIFIVSILSIVSESSLFKKMLEYAILFTIFGYTSTNKTFKQVIFSIPVAMAIISNFLTYGRIIGLQIALIPIMLFFIRRAKKSFILFLVVLGIFSMTYFGLIGDSNGSVYVSFEELIKVIKTRQFTLDTAVFAFHCSATSIDALMNVFSFGFRLKTFFYSSIWMLVGAEALNNVPHYLYSLQDLTAMHYTHWNGGLLPFYFMFWLGIPGVIFVGWFTAYLVNNTVIKSSKSYFAYFIGIYLLCSFMRWYLYLPYIRTLALIVEIFCVKLLFLACIKGTKLSINNFVRC